MVVCNSAAHVQHWQGIIPDSHNTVHDRAPRACSTPERGVNGEWWCAGWRTEPVGVGARGRAAPMTSTSATGDALARPPRRLTCRTWLRKFDSTCKRFFISRHGGGPGRGHGRREGVETVQKLCGSLARSQGHPIAPGRTGPTGKGGAIQISVAGKGLTDYHAGLMCLNIL